MIGGTVALSIFFNQWLVGWPIWAWPVAGVAAEIAVIISSLTDKGELQKVMESLFREKYSTGGFRDRACGGRSMKPKSIGGASKRS